MKVLVFHHMQDRFFTSPRETQLRIKQTSRDYCLRYRKAGKLLEIYNVSTRQSPLVTIWEVESADELDRIFLENPAYPYIETETFWLTEWERRMKHSLELLSGS